MLPLQTSSASISLAFSTSADWTDSTLVHLKLCMHVPSHIILAQGQKPPPGPAPPPAARSRQGQRHRAGSSPCSRQSLDNSVMQGSLMTSEASCSTPASGETSRDNEARSRITSGHSQRGLQRSAAPHTKESQSETTSRWQRLQASAIAHRALLDWNRLSFELYVLLQRSQVTTLAADSSVHASAPQLHNKQNAPHTSSRSGDIAQHVLSAA